VSARFGERLDARSLAAIGDVAPQVAATVSLAVLNDELARTGARLTEARLEERRILRRDLHDGLGPALAGIGLGLQAYRNLRATDPTAADALLDRLCDEVDQRVHDVRQLSRQLLPPAVEELGLGAALRELAERFESAGTAVRVDAPELSELDPPLVNAAYAIASEALVNAQRHGQARHVDITVRRDPDLTLVISNDGRPIDPAAPTGIGLRSMRERVRELGGSLRVATGADGLTVVRATLPVGGGA
jgi:signal transduction histidine kinase